MDEKLTKHKGRMVQYLVTLSVSLGSLTMGVSSAWPTPVLPKFQNNQTEIKINEDQVAWMMAMTAPGFASGSLVTRFVADRLGRRASVLASALPVAFGSILVTFALVPWLLYVTRFMWGVGIGMLGSITQMYLAEIADKEIRATLSLITRVAFNLGNLLVMSIGVSVSYDCLNYMLLALPITYFVACLWIPESPYYYLKEGQVDAARRVLKRIWRNKDSKELDEGLENMENDVNNEMRHSSSFKELFSSRKYRKAIIIAVGLRITQTMTGMLTIRQYLGRIMEQSRSTLELNTVLTVFGLVQFSVGIMSSIIADRVGRRPLLYYSLFGTGICLASVSVYFFFLEVVQVDQQVLRPYNTVPFAAIICANVIATLGFYSILGVIPAEIFPLNVKVVALTSLSIFGSSLGFCIGKGYQEIVNWGGLCGVFCIFSGFSIAGGLFVIFFVPETKGKSLKEIQIVLQGDAYTEAEMDALNQVKHAEITEMKEINGSANNVKA